MNNDLIERAIQSAEARIYKLEQGKKRNHTVRHQEKAENQAELQRVTVWALNKQLETKPIYSEFDKYFHCACCDYQVKLIHKYCHECGQRVNWNEV